MTTDNLLLSDTHHDERTACQVKSILIQITPPAPVSAPRQFCRRRGAGVLDACRAHGPPQFHPSSARRSAVVGNAESRPEHGRPVRQRPSWCRSERTLFMLDWLESPELRRRCHAGLNKSEQRHSLAQVICTFRAGPDRRSRHLGAAVSRLRPQPRHRRDRFLEFHLHCRCHRPSARNRKTGTRCLARPYVAAQLGAH